MGVAGPFGLTGETVQEDRAAFSFTATDDLRAAIPIEIGEDRVFHGFGGANRHAGPRPTHAFDSRMQVNPYDSALFPSRRQVRKAIAVEIAQLHAVRALRRFVNQVPPPGWFVNIHSDLCLTWLSGGAQKEAHERKTNCQVETREWGMMANFPGLRRGAIRNEPRIEYPG